MSFTGRARDTIRDQILSFWAQEYAASTGAPLLLTAPGSDAYLWASALAVMLEGLEAQAESVTRDILPDQASADALARHGDVDGVPRGAGVRARHTVTVTGPAAVTVTFAAGTRMAFSDGTLYSVDSASVVLVLSGGVNQGDIEVTAVEIGATGTRAAGATLTFVSTPTGLVPTGTVKGAPLRSGTDVESLGAWAQRIIENRRERPASGNRADWRAWVRAYTGTDIATAYVYPLLAPPATYPGAGTPDTPGCVTVVAVGPAQGQSIIPTRIVPMNDGGGTHTAGAALTRIRDYIEGARKADGTLTTTGAMLRPVTMLAANAAVEAISVAPQNVVIQLVNNAANPFPWSGSVAVALSTSTAITVVGDYSALSGKAALVQQPTTKRGSYTRITLGTGTYNGGTGNTVFDQSAHPMAESTTGTIYPCPPNWEVIQTAVFAYFDGLGPGDTTPPSRWPAENSEARATLYRTALAAEVLSDVVTLSAQGALVSTPTGVLSATVTTPAANVTPAAKTVVTLGTLVVTA